MPNDWHVREEALRAGFEELRSGLTAWGQRVDEEIKQVLAAAQFDNHAVQMKPEFRVKELRSFIFKALYRPKSVQYQDPLVDITDKVATRLVVLTLEQAKQATNLLLAHPKWQARLDKIVSIGTELGPTAFGYQSYHLLVWEAQKDRLEQQSLPTRLACEIQVRTLLHHAYAEVSHGTVYKGSYRHEPLIQRKLARSMALMEVADEDFQTMFDTINSQQLASSAFAEEMNVRFKELWPDFDVSTVNVELFSYLFDTLYYQSGVNSQKLDLFMRQNEPVLLRIVDKNRSQIAHQPIVLFVAYLLRNRPRHLFEHWELNQDILHELGHEMNISTAAFD